RQYIRFSSHSKAPLILNSNIILTVYYKGSISLWYGSESVNNSAGLDWKDLQFGRIDSFFILGAKY
ncbi:hypothetical protein, partial [Anaerosolibacter carboniphilus]|uniref:hypothetical protein n=1 Tax=Anaerosolibacter carboniphilus TaxID=1417629 RepID=UPI001A9B9307